MINQDHPAWNQSYVNELRSKVFKIIPLMQQNNKGLFNHISSITNELNGMQYVIEDLENNHIYLVIWAVLESTLDELIAPDPDTVFIRSEILRIVNSMDKLQKRGG